MYVITHVVVILQCTCVHGISMHSQERQCHEISILEKNAHLHYSSRFCIWFQDL